MQLALINWLGRFKENIKPYLEEKMIIKKKEKNNLKTRIKEAHQEWLEAEQYFNNVSEAELVDHASYLVQATRTKYIYLLNKAKGRAYGKND